MQILLNPNISYTNLNKTIYGKQNIKSLPCYDTIQFSGKNSEDKPTTSEFLNKYLDGINSNDPCKEEAAMLKFVSVLENSDVFYDDELIAASDLFINKAIENSNSKLAGLYLKALCLIAFDYNLKDSMGIEKSSLAATSFESNYAKKQAKLLIDATNSV